MPPVLAFAVFAAVAGINLGLLARAWLIRPTVKRRFEQLTGVAFLGFGLKLALDRGPR